MKTTGWLKGLEVTADGTGIVSHAGVALLRALSDRTGLTAGLSRALASDRLLIHDRGRVLADLACAVADGAEVISDFRVMTDQAELFGLVASVPTAWRTLDEIAAGGGRAQARITRAVNAARRRAWAAIEARHGALPGVRVADKVLDGVTCLRLDASVVACHSDKAGAEPNFKGFGLHPLGCWCDNTGEPLAGMLRPGSAGSNTTADHLTVLDAAIAALPPRHRRRLMVTCDGAGASHGLIERLDALAARPGHQLVYSVGWELGKREKAAITQVPEDAWQIAVSPRGEVRERRADDACADRSCAHRRCWIEEAHVAELTGLLRQGPAGDQLTGWPAAMRVFARRERPHPGAQLTLFEAEDGWRYSLWVTNRPSAPAAGAASPPTSTPLTGCMPGWRTPSAPGKTAASAGSRPDFGDQLRVAGRVPDRRGPAGLAAAHRPGRRPRPRRAQDPALQDPAHRRETRPRRPSPTAENPCHLALGKRHRHRLDPDHRPAAGTLTSSNPPLQHRRSNPGARGTPGPRPASRTAVIPRP